MEPTAALLALGKLVGVLNASGVVEWVWFGDPASNALKSMPKNRDNLGELFSALLGDGSTTVAFSDDIDGKLVWVPLDLTVVQVGIVWTGDEDRPLELGVGAKVAIDPATLAVVAELLAIEKGGAESTLGQVRFAGTLPVPDFLSEAALTGAVHQTDPPEIALVVTDNAARERSLKLRTPTLMWDCARLAVFVVRAIVNEQTGEGFERINEHLFAMLGDPPSPLKPFPLVGDKMGTSPNFAPWTDDVLSTENNAAGALTFLWHARALLTGNEDSSFLEGSVFFPLDGGTNPGSGPPGPGDVSGSFGDAEPAEGVFLGVTTEGPTSALVVEFRDGDARARITLAEKTDGKLSRPTIGTDNSAQTTGTTNWDDLDNYLTRPGSLQGLLTANKETDPKGKDSWILTLVSEVLSDNGPFGGTYSLELVLTKNEPVGYRLRSPVLDLDLPPAVTSDPALFAGLVQWILGALPPKEADPLATVTKELVTFLHAAVTGDSPTPAGLVAAVLSPLGGDVPLSVSVDNGLVSPSLTLGPFATDAFYIGKVTASAAVRFTTKLPPVEAFHLSLNDVRLGKSIAGTAPALVERLLPDLREVPGFLLNFAWDGKGVSLSGGGKVPIQRTLGPVDIDSLLVDAADDSINVGIDLAFQLAAIRVTAFGFGLHIPFNGEAVKASLDGLGVGLDTGAVRLQGTFLQGASGSEYAGGALVSVGDMFELSAIGGYTEARGGSSSLFIFASLVAPLGGPPYCFVTGIAGGFGYNCSLPPTGLLAKHPFIRVMSGEIGLDDKPSSALEQLGDHFEPNQGQHWVAAGVQFTSFGFIEGKLVVALGLGHDLSMTILGTAAFGISRLAYFEIGFEAMADKERFLLTAGISPNSYVIHREMFGLRGDFGLGVWYSGEHAGDFVLSIGGYHPDFPTPDHYPELKRVGVNALLYGLVRVTAECFFACTPRALMAGADVVLSAEFGGIAAGLRVYVDVLIQWDPFFMQARMGVAVWFEFFGRHEVSVELEIHTPEFGGLATIDVELTSFEFQFGTPLARRNPPKLAEFLTRQLGVPARTLPGDRAQVATFNTDDAAGLIRVDLLFGRSTTEQPTKSSKQQGVETALEVEAEFAFSVRTSLPLNVKDLDETVLAAPDPDGPVLEPPPMHVTGFVDLPLCGLMDLTSKLTVTATPTAPALPPQTEWLADWFPAANFGELLPAAQAGSAGARETVHEVRKQDAVIALVDGLVVSYAAILHPDPAGSPVIAGRFEPSRAESEYPLPLSRPESSPPIRGRDTRPKLVVRSDATGPVVKPRQALPTRRAMALSGLKQQVRKPLHALVRTADLTRPTAASRVDTLTVASPPPGAVAVSPPASPVRRRETFGVSLRVLPMRAPVAVRNDGIKTLGPARNVRTHRLDPAAGADGALEFDGSVSAGEAIEFTIAGDRPQRIAVRLSGSQTVRAIILGSGGDVIADLYLTGNQTFGMSSRSRRITVFGEGFLPPVVSSTWAGGGGAPTAQENVGIEQDNTLLALGPRTFAGHGCVVQTPTALPYPVSPLDAVPGSTLLASLSGCRVVLPVATTGSSLVLRVAPLVEGRDSAVEDVRWMSLDATLSDLAIVNGADETALVMSVEAVGPWSFEMDIGPRWRLVGVAVCRRSRAELVELLRSTQHWDLVDDRLQQAPAGTRTDVRLEVS